MFESKTELSEQEERREEFWTASRDRIEEVTPLQPRTPGPHLFYSNPIGKSCFRLSFVFSATANERYVYLVTADDEEAYWQLEVEREQIEDESGVTRPARTRRNPWWKHA